MTEDKDRLLNLNEAAEFLEITEDNLRKLAENGKIPAYKVGGIFLRFKLEQLEALKSEVKEKWNNLSQALEEKKVMSKDETGKITFIERLKEFWHFYDFYIITLLIISFILYIIFIMEM